MSKQNGKAILKEPRQDEKHTHDPELMSLIADIKTVAKTTKLSFENVVQAYELLELKRCNAICAGQGKGSEEQLERVGRHLDDIARTSKDAADSLYYISEARR